MSSRKIIDIGVSDPAAEHIHTGTNVDQSVENACTGCGKGKHISLEAKV